MRNSIFSTLIKVIVSTIGLSILSFSISAETPSEKWLTYESDNFRIHFTPPYRDWAITSAKELEIIRERVKASQNRVLTEKVDVIVFDPINSANGSAVPLSHKPFMRLYATPPQSDSVLNNLSSWRQILLLHEYIHLVHLGQHSRNNTTDTIANWWDIYDILAIPLERWVAEGYATLQESKMTGRGRLYDTLSESLIQQFAREGSLPTYNQLSSTEGGYLRGSMAYLLGVRYLKWLEDNYSAATLDAVWTRWRAVHERDFEQAFTGVFQSSPKKLYKRFIAELTHKVLSEDRLNTAADNSSLWLDQSVSTRGLTLSPNEKSIAVVETDLKRNFSLKVYSTEENTKAKEAFQKKITKLQKADPQDIFPPAPELFRREQKYQLLEKNNRGIAWPRWLSNDQQILYIAKTKDKRNNLHNDLYLWDLTSGKTRRITKHSNIRRFDISENDDHIIAEQNRYGKSSLVKVDLATGLLTEILSEPNTIYDFPRLSSNNQLAYLSHKPNHYWQLKVLDQESGNLNIIPMPKNYQYLSYPEWSHDNESIYFVAGMKSKIAIYNYNFASKKLSQISSAQHPIANLAASKSDSLLYAAHNSEGVDIYYLPDEKKLNQNIRNLTSSSNSDLSNVAKFITLPPPLLNTSSDKNSSKQNISNYGLGPQEYTIIANTIYNSASTPLFEVGVKGGDLLNRFNWQLTASSDFDNALSGINGQIRWLGWPIKAKLEVFDTELNYNKQSEATIGNNLETQLKRQGAFLSLNYPVHTFETLELDIVAQALAGESNKESENFWSLGFNQNWSTKNKLWGIEQSASTHWYEGHSQNIDWRGFNNNFSITGYYSDYGLKLDAYYKKRLDLDSNSNLLSLGGYQSTLISMQANPNMIFEQALPFASQFSNQYESYQATFKLSSDGPNPFYQKHKMELAPDLDIYGFKYDGDFDAGFIGLRDINFDLGIAEVTSDDDKKSTQFWLGFYYKL